MTNLWPSNSRSNLEMFWFFEEGKTGVSRSKDENQQQTQPIFDAKSGNFKNLGHIGGRPVWKTNAQPLHRPCSPKGFGIFSQPMEIQIKTYHETNRNLLGLFSLWILFLFQCKTIPMSLTFSPDGKLFATLATDRKVRYWQSFIYYTPDCMYLYFMLYYCDYLTM